VVVDPEDPRSVDYTAVPAQPTQEPRRSEEVSRDRELGAIIGPRPNLLKPPDRRALHTSGDLRARERVLPGIQPAIDDAARFAAGHRAWLEEHRRDPVAAQSRHNHWPPGWGKIPAIAAIPGIVGAHPADALARKTA